MAIAGYLVNIFVGINMHNNIQIKKAVGFFAAAILLSLIFPVVTSGAAISTILYKSFLILFVGIGVLYLLYWALDKLGI